MTIDTTQEHSQFDRALEETLALLQAMTLKYRALPDVPNSRNAAALVHMVGKELSMIVDQKKSTITPNATLREQSRSLAQEVEANKKAKGIAEEADARGV